jgi:hypothetical protein
LPGLLTNFDRETRSGGDAIHLLGDDAVKQIGGIEQTLGFADLAQITAPAPPKA